MPPAIVTIKFALLPAHIVLVPDTLNTAAVGEGFTVTAALPVMLGLGAVEVQSVATFVTLTIVYVVLTVGDTPTVALFAIPLALKFVVPSVYTTLKVPAGRVNVRLVEVPAQIVAFPPIDAVGSGRMLTIRALVISP